MEKVFSVILLSLLLFSCGKSLPIESLKLSKAEFFMLTHADSALSILSAMPIPTDKARQATWCLLFTQAQDKNSIRHTCDSLIQIALHYFEKRSDHHRYATALYYAGRVQDDLYKEEKAAQYYVQAFNRAELVKDYHLMALVSSRLGGIYRQISLKDKALEQQFLSYTCNSLAKDTVGVIYSLREIGTCYLHLSKLDSALHFYQKALDLSGWMKDTLTATLLNDIGVIYRKQNKLEQSILYFRKAIPKTTKQINLYATYLALGSSYLKQQQLDSAVYYLSKSGLSPNYYTKAGSYLQLYDLEKLRGNYKQAIGYNDLYLQFRDSIDDIDLKKKVAEIEARYDYVKPPLAIIDLELKKSQQAKKFSFLALGLLITIVLVYLFLQKRLSKKEKELQNHKEDLRLHKKQLEQNERQIRANEILIASNYEKIEDLLRTNKVEFEKKRQENEDQIHQNEKLKQENEYLRLDISKRKSVLEEGKAYEDRLKEINTIKKYLIQMERNRGQRLSLQNPMLKSLLGCVYEKKPYVPNNWKEIIFIIDDFYDGLLTALKESFPSLSDDDMLACALLLINLRNVDIAYATGVDVRTMHKRIERLAKKLKIPKGDDLITVLLGDLRVQMSMNVDNISKNIV